MNQVSYGNREPLASSLSPRLDLNRAKAPRSPKARRRLGGALALLAFCLGLTLSRAEAAEPEAGAAALSHPAPSPRGVQDLVVRGIYVQQLTAQNPRRLQYLIDKALKTGLNTFVVDVWGRSARYAEGVKAIQAAGLSYVPRVTIFPDGATPEQVDDPGLLEKRWRLIDYALSLGAKDVQLDYIRFSSRNSASPDNAGKILQVLRFFRKRLEERGARLQIDVFGEVSYGPSIRIGQDMRRFAPELDAVCPMLYPSHFEPYLETAKTPYETVHGALTALAGQTEANPLPVYAYIEHFNYRYPMTDPERAKYLESQLQAVLDSGAQGFYVWSAGNYYDILFNLLGQGALAQRKAPAQAPARPELAREDTTSGKAPDMASSVSFGPPMGPHLASGAAQLD